LLKEGETFYGPSNIIYYYLKRSQHYTSWQFDVAFNQQFGRDPSLPDVVKYFHPENESVRYFFVNPYIKLGKDVDAFKATYLPYDVIRIDGLDVFYVYDLKNLREKA